MKLFRSIFGVLAVALLARVGSSALQSDQDQQCELIENVEYRLPNSLITQSPTPTPSECCSRCGRQLHCDVFSYNSESGACALYSLGSQSIDPHPALGTISGKVRFSGKDVPVVNYSMLYENARVLLHLTNLDTMINNHAAPLMDGAAKFTVVAKSNKTLTEEEMAPLLLRHVEMTASPVFTAMQKEGATYQNNVDLYVSAAVYFLLHLAQRPLCANCAVKDNFADEREWGMYLYNTASSCYLLVAYYVQSVKWLQEHLVLKSSKVVFPGELIESLLSQKQEAWETSAFGVTDILASPRMVLLAIDAFTKNGGQGPGLNYFAVNIGAADIPITEARDQQDAINQLFSDGWGGVAIEPDVASFQKLVSTE
jgi:hypothetical protein